MYWILGRVACGCSPCPPDRSCLSKALFVLVVKCWWQSLLPLTVLSGSLTCCFWNQISSRQVGKDVVLLSESHYRLLSLKFLLSLLFDQVCGLFQCLGCGWTLSDSRGSTPACFTFKCLFWLSLKSNRQFHTTSVWWVEWLWGLWCG